MNYHFVLEKVAKGQFLTQFVKFKDQLTNIHTKAFKKTGFHNKLGVTVPSLTSLRNVLKET